MIIGQGKNTPLNANTGTMPNVSDAMLNYFQPMAFDVVTTVVENFQSVQTMVVVNFKGVWQPLSPRQLILKPEGQRDWPWYWVHSDPSLQLKNDDVITYLGKQYRVMSVKDWRLNGYMEYHLIGDWVNAGPSVVTP